MDNCMRAGINKTCNLQNCIKKSCGSYSHFIITNLKHSSVKAELNDNIKIILYILTILASSSAKIGVLVAGVTI